MLNRLLSSRTRARLWLLALLCCAAPAFAGKVFLSGGAYDDKDTDLFVNGLRKATGKDSGYTPNINSTSNCSTDWAVTACPRIAVVTSAKETTALGEDAYLNDLTASDGSVKRGYYNLFQTHGFSPKWVNVHVDNYGSGAYSGNTLGDQNIATIRQADVVWFIGGDQAKIARSWLKDDGSDTPLAAALRAAWNNGQGAVVIAGDSAGNHILNATMHGAGVSYGYLYYGANLQAKSIVDYAQFGDTRDGCCATLRYSENGVTMKGLGFLPTALLSDTHFDARSGRLGRLVAAMRQIGINQGVGVDQDTGALVDTAAQTIKVFGNGNVMLVDSAQASAVSGTWYKVNGLRLSYLTRGDSYNYASRTVTSSKPAIGSPYYSSYYDSADIYAANEIVTTVTHLVDQSPGYNIGTAPVPAYSTAPQYPSGSPVMHARFTRDAATRGYYGSGRYTAAKVLVDLY